MKANIIVALAALFVLGLSGCTKCSSTPPPAEQPAMEAPAATEAPPADQVVPTEPVAPADGQATPTEGEGQGN